MSTSPSRQQFTLQANISATGTSAPCNSSILSSTIIALDFSTKVAKKMRWLICFSGICRDHGKSYVVYLVSVTKTLADDTSSTWDVYRRYSDFHDLHQIILEKVRRKHWTCHCDYFSVCWYCLKCFKKCFLQFESIGGGLVLPSKKTFNNMNKEFIERRKTGLNAYLQVRRER